MEIYYFNKLLIKLLPYTLLFSFLLQFNDLSFYNSIGIASMFLFMFSILTLPNFRIKEYTIYLLLFATYIVMSDIFIAKNTFSFYTMVIKNRYLYFFFLANIIENTKILKSEIKNMMLPLLITVLASFIVIIIQQILDRYFMTRQVLDNFTNENTSLSEVRLTSLYTYTVLTDVILYFVPISAILTSYYLNIKQAKMAILITILALLTTFLTKSRGALTTALPLLFLLYLGRTTKYTAKQMMTALIYFVFITISISWLSERLKFNEIIENRILESSKDDFEDKTAYTRIIAVQAFVECYQDAPFFGAGNTKFGIGGSGSWNNKLDVFLAGRSSQIHVGVLALFYLYGAVGGLFYSLFYYKLTRRFYLISKRTKFWGTFFGILVILIMNLSMDFYDPFAAGILLCIVFNKYLENQINNNSVNEIFSRKIRQHIPARS